jgi:hypothetical protein
MVLELPYFSGVDMHPVAQNQRSSLPQRGALSAPPSPEAFVRQLMESVQGASPQEQAAFRKEALRAMKLQNDRMELQNRRQWWEDQARVDELLGRSSSPRNAGRTK